MIFIIYELCVDMM